MISRKLMEAVIGNDIFVDIGVVTTGGEITEYILKGEYDTSIDYFDIHRLAHKCKEWAATLGFNVSSNLVTTMITSNDTRELFDAPTEPEAIFKACEWILEQQ